MAKDKAQNPATAHLKSQKVASIKKAKTQQQQQRVEKLARRNPDRLQKQIDELQRLKGAQGGKLRAKDEETLTTLERDLKGVKKAREIRGEHDHAGKDRARGNESGRGGHGGRGRSGTHLGKRGRDEGDQGEADSTDTDPEVRDIPMPRDTPPPIPPRWVRDKARKRGAGLPEGALEDRKEIERQDAPSPKAPRTTYSSAPQIRDLRKEATDKFMPAAVKARLEEQEKTRKGIGKLPEPEDVDAREHKAQSEQKRIEEEEKAFQRELEEEQEETEQQLKAADQRQIDELSRGGKDGILDATDDVPKVASGSHNVEIEEVDDEEG